HTRFSRDWSSDVCSSDLPGQAALSDIFYPMLCKIPEPSRIRVRDDDAGRGLVLPKDQGGHGRIQGDLVLGRPQGVYPLMGLIVKIGRASCRERSLSARGV